MLHIGRNFVIFIVDYNKMKLQRRECAGCVFLVLFSSRIALYECIIESIYMFRCIYFFHQDEKTTLHCS